MNVKIIKQFEDHEQYLKHFSPPNDGGTWYWGLSDTGIICCRIPTITGKNWEAAIFDKPELTISLINKLAKEFGHLATWL